MEQGKVFVENDEYYRIDTDAVGQLHKIYVASNAYLSSADDSSDWQIQIDRERCTMCAYKKLHTEERHNEEKA